MSVKSARKPLKFEKNTIEALKDGSAGVARTTATAIQQEANLDVNLAWRQLLGVNEETNKNIRRPVREGPVGRNDLQEIKEGEEIVLSKKEKRVQAAPAIEYFTEIVHSERRISNEQNKQLNVKIEELRIEIAKLAKSSKQLEVVVKDVTIDNIGPNPGKYHLNFFEWVLATIRTARIRIEDSASWLNAVSSKSRRKDYWSLAKKHGTTYSLSGERVVAQQTG